MSVLAAAGAVGRVALERRARCRCRRAGGLRLFASARARRSVASGVGGDVAQLVVGVKGAEVQRHVGPSSPAIHVAQPGELVRRESFSPGMSSVVTSGHTSVSCTRYSSVSSTGSRCERGELVVEALGERLQVDVRRVHLRVEARAAARRACSRRSPPRSSTPTAWQASATSIAYSAKIVRVVVGEGDALAAGRCGRARDHLGGRLRRRAGPSRATSRCPSSGRTGSARLQPAVPNESTLEPG